MRFCHKKRSGFQSNLLFSKNTWPSLLYTSIRFQFLYFYSSFRLYSLFPSKRYLWFCSCLPLPIIISLITDTSSSSARNFLICSFVSGSSNLINKTILSQHSYLYYLSIHLSSVSFFHLPGFHLCPTINTLYL